METGKFKADNSRGVLTRSEALLTLELLWDIIVLFVPCGCCNQMAASFLRSMAG